MLFYWHSKALQNYAYGFLIADAATADEARAKLRRAFEEHAKDRWSYLDTADEYDQEQMAQHLAAFDKDIAKEPKICEALCIDGGE